MSVQMLEHRITARKTKYASTFKAHATGCKYASLNEHCVPKPCVQFVHGSSFSILCSLMTVLFAVSVGIQAEVDINSALLRKEAPIWPTTIVNVFNIWFAFA